MSGKAEFIPYQPSNFSKEETEQRSLSFYHEMNKRRSLRMFSDQPVPKKVLENIILTAGTAPSG
ncbi:MAG: nitroreductase family protein, partial [Salibacteraceae bacterium]|nr:nitroreductase family protein [Salibacteraceae bacterium]